MPALNNSTSRLLLSEVLRKVSNAKTKNEKIKLLRDYSSVALRQILIINFDDSLVSMLPEGDVPYTPNDAPVGTEHTRLESEYKGLYRFFKGGADKLPSLKRESMFVQLLEGLSAEEAELLCLVKDGRLSEKYKRITKSVVSEAYPQIQWGGRS
ncbi:gp225 [Synechococcus phage syn9]|uniref:Gp225 n=1 Tax=Synechococcus phage syn9 TaxID=382359 RepID=Q0QZ01_BPSYS|nr:gp225 [Synechococcus phage syn9]ABA47194.1 gp225 [Synechococcus phage syn9]